MNKINNIEYSNSYRIILDTYEQAIEFSKACENLSGKIIVTDSEGHCVNAKSLLGMLYMLECEDLQVFSENSIYRVICKFVKE